MMKKSINDICISSSCFCMLILLAKIVINDCECTNGEAFLKSGNCISNCDDNELFQDKSCIPISKKEEDITNMFNKIVSYYKSIAPNTYGNKIMIEGEGINYIITTSSLESSNRNNNGDSYLLNLSEDCINSINEVASNYFIVLINIINTNYITTTNGIRIFNNNDKFVLSGLCNKQVFNIGIPVEVTNKEISLYKNIKNSNGYEIFNIYDLFYTDKCTKFTSEYNTDLSLQKRNEIYGIYSKEVCSDFCTYQKFNETELKIYCKCIYGEEHKRVEIETGGFNIKVIKCISKIGKGFMKNYMFFIVSILCFLFIVCFIISCISLSGTISGYVKEFEELKIKFLNYYKLEEKKEVKGKRKKGNKKKGAIKKEEKEKNDDIYEEENEDDNEDEGEEEEEEEEGLDESNETYVNKKNDINNNQNNPNNQNNINNMNYPYFNFYMNNSAFNPYIQYHQYQQYQIQMYNQYIDYLRNINNNYNNNEKEERENEEEEEDEEDIKENNERKKRYRYNFFPQFKKIDKNAVYTLKLDYDKVKEYSRMMKQNKENQEGSKKPEEETKKEKKLKLNKIKKKEDKKDNKKNKHKDKDKENENKSKLKNESKNKKDVKKIKKQDEDMNENNHIDIFKKKVEQNNIKDFINNKNLKKNDIENEKKKKHKSKNKDKDLKHLLKNQKEKIEKKVNDGNIIRKHATDKNNNINIKRKDKKASKTAKIDKLDLNMNYKNKNDKPNPPKNSNASERELISPEIKSNDDLKIINCKKEEIEKNEKEENKNEEEEEGEEEEDNDDNENDESGVEKNDDEENDESGVEKNDDEEKDEEDDKEKNDDENWEEKKEEIDEKEEKKSDINDRMQDNKEIKDKNKEEEKEQKILKLNLNSNGENSTLSNIINNSKKNDAEKISIQKPMSNSTKIEDKAKFEIKFGSVEFYKMLNKIPEAKRIDFFNSSELNYMEYKYTCDYDERTFFKIYFSMIKEENNIIYSISFCTSDYNLSLVKFSFLIIQIILYLTVSVLFFTDDTINNIFDKQNKFDIRYMILPMVFTFIICFLICMILKALIKTNNNVIDIKYEIQTYEEGLYTIRLKLIFYFFIGFIISACGWILISSWSSVFTNSQIKLIEFAGFTLGAHFILQIIYCLLITSLRICSLNSESKNNSCLYKFSKILTYF